MLEEQATVQATADAAANAKAEQQSELTEDQQAIDAIRKFTDEDDHGDLSIKAILGGDILTSKFMMRQVLFVMFLVVLAILYTGNRYGSQQDAILIDSLRNHLQDVKYNVLTQSSELMNLTRQSSVEKALRTTKDSILQNPVTPPYLIRTNEERRQVVKEENIQEVLVDSAHHDSVAVKKESDEI